VNAVLGLTGTSVGLVHAAPDAVFIHGGDNSGEPAWNGTFRVSAFEME